MDTSTDPRHAAFEELASRVTEPVRRFLARRTDAATADDVLGEVFVVLWRRLAEAPEDPLPWAYGIARHCLANAERGTRRQRRLATRIAVVDPPSEAGPEDAPHDLVHTALAALRDEDAELLRLWAWEQLTPTEIAAVLGVSVNVANVRLHRAREKFRAELGKSGADPGHDRVTGRRKP